MNLEIRHLKLVCAVAEECSVTRAAHRLHLTQSALSHQLRDAEEKLNTRIFERSGRKMKLTAAGQRLLRSAQTVLQELTSVEKELGEGYSGVSGTLRLTTECCTVYYWLPARVKAFQSKFPDVSVRVVVEPSLNPFQALLEEKLDLVIACNPIRNRQIEYIPLFEDENVLLVPASHRLASKQHILADDMAGENLLVYPPKKHSSFMNEVLVPAKVAPRSVQEVMLTEAMIEMVRAGLGVAALCRWIVAPHLRDGTLRTIPITPSGFWRSWWIARLKSASPSAPLTQFINLLTAEPFQIPGGRQRAQA
jgi:LysR family transcriptional regulator, regulator for metE and metH